MGPAAPDLAATGGGSNIIEEGCFDDDATVGIAGIQNPERDDDARAAAGGGGGGGGVVPDGMGCALTTGGGGGGAGAAPPGAVAIRIAGGAPVAGGNGGGAPVACTAVARITGGAGGRAATAWFATGVLGSRIACGTPGVGGRDAGTPRGSATGAVWFWRMIWLACAVPSAPHTGQTTTRGIWPFTGCTSNLYFAPQLQKILISMRRSAWCSPAVNPSLSRE